MSGVVLGQMLPDGCVVKGGTSMLMRFGPGNCRVTMDFDTARRGELERCLSELRQRLEVGWCDFTGDVVIRKPATPRGVPFDYVMQPIDVKLAYRHHPWCTVRLEVSHDELGSAEVSEYRELPERIKSIFTALNFPKPSPVPLMCLPFQIAQKLHGVSQPGGTRVRDLIDLQLIVANEDIDWASTSRICRRIFAYRKMQQWPVKISSGVDWNSLYDVQRGGLPVLPTVEAAIDWANDLVRKIDEWE